MDRQTKEVLSVVENNDDPLLSCLCHLTKHFGKPYSAESLSSGLPLKDGYLTPELFQRAAEKAELSSGIYKRELDDLSSLTLPCIVLLEANKACVLHTVNRDGTAEVAIPEAGGVRETRKLSELKELATGYVIFVKNTTSYDTRANEYNIEKPKSWFWGTLWRFKANYYKVIVAAFIINLFALASPLFVMNVYDRVVPNHAISTLWVLAIGVTIVFAFDFMMKLMRGYLIDVSGRKADMLFSSMIFQQIMRLRMEARPQSAGSFANNVHGFEAVREFYTSATLATLIDLPFIFMFVAVIAFIAGPLAFVPMLAIPVVIISAFLIEKPIHRAVEASYFGAAQKQAMLVENINNLEAVKTLSAEGLKQRQWEKYVAIVAKAGMKSRFFSSLALNLCGYVIQMVTVCMVVWGVYRISEGLLTVGGLIACVILSGRSLAPLSQITGLITRYQQSLMGMDSLNSIMELPQERTQTSHFLHRPKLHGEIDFDNVSFVYPETEHTALKDITLKIQPGEKIALLGRVGSGKSTLLQLILGLYQASSGSIRHDGTEIEQIDPADLRNNSNIGYVAQDSKLFFGTLRENITMAAPGIEEERMIEVAKIAGVSRFASLDPQGYDKQIGEGGRGLSGGQRQSVVVARALLLNPQILLMDEPSSSMDETTEREFIQNLKEVMSDQTMVITTHKSSMLELVDRLIIVDNGKIVADGPKEQILAVLTQNDKKKVKPINTSDAETSKKPSKRLSIQEG